MILFFRVLVPFFIIFAARFPASAVPLYGQVWLTSSPP
jgi:hypothetical protein